MRNILFINEESVLNKWPVWLRRLLAILAMLSLIFVLSFSVKTFAFDNKIVNAEKNPANNSSLDNKNSDEDEITSEDIHIDENSDASESEIVGDILPYYNGYSWKRQDGFWYPVDESGMILLKDILDKGFIRPGSIFEDGVAGVCEDGKWGLVDVINGLYIKPEYDDPIRIDQIYHIQQAYRISFHGKYSILDKDAQMILLDFYDWIDGYSKDQILYYDWPMVGSVNIAAGAVIPPIYEDINPIYEDPFCIVKKDGLYGLTDEKGKILLPIQYQFLEHNYDDTLLVQEGGLWGIIDYEGNYIINPLYSSLHHHAFGSGLNLVSISNKQEIDEYGIIDDLGEYLVPPVYDYIGDAYEKDYYYAIYQGEKGYLDRDFNFVTEMDGDNFWQPGAWSEKEH